ncbi:MAG: trypsin-like peptidase domain-containing protein [Bacteroidales bacterium]|nr:trypsin-like peptidase domain-containing protein [Bacteroidales bacterium]
MLSQVWKSCHGSVCSLNFQNERGISIDTLSGFKVNESLVTTDFAFYIPKAKKVEISFVGDDANSVVASMKIPYKEFINDLRIGVFDDHTGYSIFNLDFPDFKIIPSLKLSERRKFPIGQQVALLAFSLGYSNLSLRSGIISSFFTNHDGLRFFQYDGISCLGNSGGPIIDPETMQVMGIVSRRNTPVSRSYKQLVDIITANIDELSKIQGVVKYGDIDPIQVLIANQSQIKQLANNIYRYSAFGTTPVVMLDKILSYFNQNTVIESCNERIKQEYDLNLS